MIQALLAALFLANPFAIDFPPKKDLTHDDYVEVQKQLRSKEVSELLSSLYVPGLSSYSDFLARVTKGFNQILIDPAKGQYPIQKLEKIGRGGGNCIVCCIPYNEPYPAHLDYLITQLEKVGFNGHIYYRIGGFPNPTGAEITYAGVPYCFKIFAMIEAHQLGFSQLMWLDARARPLRDPKPLFRHIEKVGALINWASVEAQKSYILPNTEKLLKERTGTLVTEVPYVNSIVFGLNMNEPLVRDFITNYYALVGEGTPFLSCFPEEWVFTAIFGQARYQNWRIQPSKILTWVYDKDPNYKKYHKKALEKGYFFER